MYKSILNKSFRYIPSSHTDLAATFKKARKEIEEKKKQERAIVDERILKVRKLG